MTIKDIQTHVALAHALLSQKTISHFHGQEHIKNKPVTTEDVAKVKEILRDIHGELEELNNKQAAACAALVKTIIG